MSLILRALTPALIAAVCGQLALAQSPPARTGSPADDLPPHITQLTGFGERADWSHDGKRILFLSKTFGDAFEIDLATKHIRNLTAGWPHHGFTRALYLANGDILLSGPDGVRPGPSEGSSRAVLAVRAGQRFEVAGPAIGRQVRRRARRVAHANAHCVDAVGGRIPRRDAGRRFAHP